MHSLRVIAFVGASNWPLWVGHQRGLFEREGIDLALSLTPNSVFMAQALFGGGADIALTSIDNVIAYNNGHGEVKLPGAPDFFAFMGVDGGLLSLMSRPDIDAIKALRGRTLAVDALTTGFAFVLQDILERNGVSKADVVFKAVGTGAERLAALKAGDCDGTLLNEPLCFAAQAAGLSRLAVATDIVGSYQGVVGAARKSWAKTHPDVVKAFIRAFHASIAWLDEDQNKEMACAILKERLPVTAPVIDAAYDLLITRGEIRKSLEIDWKGVECVIGLRNQHSNLGRVRDNPEEYVDERFRLSTLA